LGKNDEMNNTFNLEKVRAGKPFGRMEGDKFVKATHYGIYSNFLAVEFENALEGELKFYNKDGTTKWETFLHPLIMAPEEVVWYGNMDSSGPYPGVYHTLEEAKKWAEHACLGQFKLTITGNDFNIEKV